MPVQTLYAPQDYPTQRTQVRAYTIAAFRVAQLSDQLSLVPMSKDVIDFLVKGRAIGYWKEQEWLQEGDDAYRLTADGLVVCQSALASQLETHNTDASTVAHWVREFRSNAALPRCGTFDV